MWARPLLSQCCVETTPTVPHNTTSLMQCIFPFTRTRAAYVLDHYNVPYTHLPYTRASFRRLLWQRLRHTGDWSWNGKHDALTYERVVRAVAVEVCLMEQYRVEARTLPQQYFVVVFDASTESGYCATRSGLVHDRAVVWRNNRRVYTSGSTYLTVPAVCTAAQHEKLLVYLRRRPHTRFVPTPVVVSGWNRASALPTRDTTCDTTCDTTKQPRRKINKANDTSVKTSRTRTERANLLKIQ